MVIVGILTGMVVLNNSLALATEGVLHVFLGVVGTAGASVAAAGFGFLSHKLGKMQDRKKTNHAEAMKASSDQAAKQNKDHAEAMKAIRDQDAKQNTDNEAAIVRHEAHMALLQANHEEAMNTRPKWFFGQAR